MKRDLAIRALNMAIAFQQPQRFISITLIAGRNIVPHDYQKILRTTSKYR
jgi:hypothetical protein